MLLVLHSTMEITFQAFLPQHLSLVVCTKVIQNQLPNFHK